MRPALALPALATALVVALLVPAAPAQDDLGPGKSPAPPKDHSPGATLLAATTLGPDFLRTAERVAPFLDPALLRSLDQRQRNLLLRYARNRLESPNPLARCWSPDTPLDLLLAYHAVEEAAHAGPPPARHDDDPADSGPAPRKAEQFSRRWGTTATNGSGQSIQGRPVTLTWSIVEDGTPIPGDPDIGDNDGPSNLRARLGQIYGGDTGAPQNQPWFPIFQEVFDNISAQTGINYLYEPNDDGAPLGAGAPGRAGIRADIRLGGHDIDGAGLTLAYNFFPDNGDMVIDTNDSWFNNTNNNSIRLRNTLEHEHGHGLGMEHVCPFDQTKLMEPFINSGFRGIQFDELYTLQRWYGDFYEQHGGVRDNDSFDHAAPLPVLPDVPFHFEWLSIDDSSDVDYYAVPVPVDSSLTVRVIPSTLAYLEGEQNADGKCSSGTPFDPGAHHDLALEVISPDRSTVLATAALNPAGQAEEIVAFPTPESGTHYLRVSGGSASLAQLYRLEIEVDAPEVALTIEAQRLLAESFSPPDGITEPGETVALELALLNAGTLPATDVQASLDGPSGFRGFAVAHDFGTLDPAQSAARTFVFGLDGKCGETLPLTLTITTADGLQKTIPLAFTLGIVTVLLEESFDSGDPALPAGWSSGTTANGGGWSVSATRFDSAPASLYAEDVGDSVSGSDHGSSSLTSPVVTLGGGGGTLTFRHYFDTEGGPAVGYDGGVLEISLDGAPWTDILAAGTSFLQGGYTLPLSSAFQNPLGGRQTWSGDSGGWITTVVDLPPALAHQPLRFRWRLGHDTSVGSANGFEGWFLDDIRLVSPLCGQAAPLVTLALDDATASEFAPLDRARLTISSPLPQVADLPIPLLNSGSAQRGLDASGLESVAIRAGQSAVEVVIEALNDDLVEGDESLVLSIDPAAGLATAGPATAIITISDTPYGSWAATTLGLGTANRPLDDRDRDGALNIEEYTWQTDASAPDDRPDLAPQWTAGSLRIQAPLATLPPDVLVSAETSPDLIDWFTAGIETLADGFQVTAGDSERFLRLRYALIPAAP